MLSSSTHTVAHRSESAESFATGWSTCMESNSLLTGRGTESRTSFCSKKSREKDDDSRRVDFHDNTTQRLFGSLRWFLPSQLRQ